MAMIETKTQPMVINMGPHHPSMHGVLRLMVTLDGENVFLPFQLYALWLFIRLLVSGRQVSPNQYWKILVSILLITPGLMALSSLAFSYKW